MDMEMQGSSSTERFIPVTSVANGKGVEVAPDIYSYTTQIVNICFLGNPEHENEFVLVDAGMPDSASMILKEIEDRFGVGAQPKAIVLTHAHFDHIGSIIDLVDKWNVPVYAHELEMPYLTGQKNYPLPDSTVEGGLVAKLSPLFPTEAIDLGTRVQALPKDGSIPNLANWKWIHTPGHTPGHISLFRHQDHALIAGDAFVTTKQEYLLDVLKQELEISGPPRYLTTDWTAAKQSVEKLHSLQPKLAVTGHGQPVSGTWLSENLSMLVKDFDRIAIPDHGRYVEE
ncbi:MBL fold metallo-hydrolase [Priestia flexa]|uniref:MBL fold metallo-hydrolase n=1 Tax=Priestia flexa TaxID=86664 RepID=UPI001B33DBC5|nr:MBL fold metallo-hydrolase [Priestia flexa]